jgi:hypothetical protein
MSARQAADFLQTRLSRYQQGAWRRDRVQATIEPTCPPKYRGTVTEWLWLILRVRDAIPGDETIRKALARS